MRVSLSFLVSATLAVYTNAFNTIKVGDKIPASTLHFGFPPTFVDIAAYAANKNVIVVGLPGAFTPT